MASDRSWIRPLVAGDAPGCDAVIASLPYHFGNEDGTSEITWMAVHADRRGQGIGRALMRQLTGDLRRQGRRLLLVLTVSELEEEPGINDGYGRTRAFYRSVGFVPARELPDLWPGDKALLLAMPLGPGRA
jgi:ribosomal protein S18 acetylase RimI-like enzyme